MKEQLHRIQQKLAQTKASNIVKNSQMNELLKRNTNS